MPGKRFPCAGRSVLSGFGGFGTLTTGTVTVVWATVCDAPNERSIARMTKGSLSLFIVWGIDCRKGNGFISDPPNISVDFLLNSASTLLQGLMDLFAFCSPYPLLCCHIGL